MSRQYQQRNDTGLSMGQRLEQPFSQATSDYNPMSRGYDQGGYPPQGGMPTSETLLSQYKKCTQANNEALRNARNLEEVVNIKVRAIDSKLGAQGMPFESQMHEGQFPDARGGQSGQQNYDFKFDPIHFRQKVPCMADRGFLINQAILSSSNKTKNLAFQGQIMQGRGTTAGTQKYGTLASVGGSITSPNMSNYQGANQVKIGKSTGTDADGRLFSGDHTTNQGDLEEVNNAFDNKTEAADVHTQADSKQDGEPVDPINQLKSIFKPKNKTKRPKLELNPIMNKYRTKNHSSSQQFRSQRSTRGANRNLGGINTYNGGKQFKEDMFGVPGGFSSDYHSQMNNYNQLPEIHSTQNQPMSRGMQDNASMRSSQQDGKSIKERLEDLRKLFAEEDINETVKGIQHDWELEDQKISAQKGRQASTGMAQKGTQGATLTNVEHDVNDLRGYLTKKIQQVQDRSHPDQLHREVFSGIKGIGETVPDCQYKFKASTLTHIAELKKHGQEKIENQFIERLFKQQTDFHYEQYEYNQQKEISRQATMVKAHPKNAHSSLVQSNMLAQEQSAESRQRFRTKNKPKNYVQEQLLKIERMNKESEKMNKQYQQQVKNEEIFDIIEDTQMQMANQQYMQPTNFTDIQIHHPQQPSSQHQARRSQSQQRKFVKQQQEEQEPKLDPELMGLLGTRVFDTQRVNELQEKTQLPHGVKQNTASASPTQENVFKTNETNADSPSKEGGKSPDVQNITSKVNVVGSFQAGELKDRNHEFRVSKMVQDYNIKDQAQNLYMSDSEIYAKPNSRQYVRAMAHPESRGGGFKDTRPKWKEVGTKGNALNSKNNDHTYKAKMQRSSAQQAEIEDDVLDKDVTNGNSFSYFCPKRFNRYPRFTIFFKKEHANLNDQFQAENTVSLSPQFLSYLMDKNSVMRNPIIQESTKAAEGKSIRKDDPNVFFDKSSIQDSRAQGNNYEMLQERTAGTAGNNSLPEDAVIGWNQKKEAVQNYDPFEKVVLVKGIDNSILTSFRTLKRENNTVSDTFKIVHQKFLPNKQKGLYYKQFQKNQGDKMTLYPHSDNEEALEFAHAELLAESLLHQGEDAKNDDSQLLGQDAFQINQIDSSGKQNVQVKGPNMRPNLDQVAQDALNTGAITQITSAVRASGVEQLSVIQSENISQQVNQITPRQAIKSTSGAQGSKINSQGYVQDGNVKMAALSSKDFTKKNINNEVSDVSLIGQKLQPNLFKNDPQGKVNQKLQPMQQTATSINPQYQARKLASSPLKENEGSESTRNRDGNQFKHQIEVMVLSKVDPLAGSQFPGRAQQSETNLSGSVSQNPPNNNVQKLNMGQQSHMYQSKKNPFKNGQQPGSPTIIQPQTLYNQSPKMAQSKSKLPGIQKQSKKNAKATKQVSEGQDTQELSKYGKDFKIPELPHLLQEQFFGQELEQLPQSSKPTSSVQFESANNQYKIKKFIDDIYQKEMKYRYHKQYVREDFLLTQSPIFDLQKFHHLRPQGDLLSKSNGGKGPVVNTGKAIGLDKDGKPVMHHESQSLTNVLGFQAGGPNVVAFYPKQIYQFQNQIESGPNLDGGVKGLQPINMIGQIEGIYNPEQIQFGSPQEAGDQHFNEGNAHPEGSAEDQEGGDMVGSALGNLRTSHKIISEKSEQNVAAVTQAKVSKVNN